MQALDIQKIHFSGYSLIEASAGTGKTYTISQLVLRLVLMGGLKQVSIKSEAENKAESKTEDNIQGQTQEQKQELQQEVQGLSIDQILVVTFTKAATQELKERIHANLQAAQHCLLAWFQASQLQQSFVIDYSDVQQALLAQALGLAESDSSAEASTLIQPDDFQRVNFCLQKAMFQMDEAPIFTIHSFCQNVLQEHSLYTGVALEQTLEESPNGILLQLAQKLWRESFYSFSGPQVSLLEAWFKSPELLVKSLANLLSEHLIDKCQIEPSAKSFAHFNQACEEAEQRFAALQSAYQQSSAEFHDLFLAKSLGSSYRKNHMPARIEALANFMQSGSALSGLGSVDDSKNKLRCFYQSFINEKANAPFDNPLCQQLEVLAELQERLAQVLVSLVRNRMQHLLIEYKQANNISFFDDLVEGLYQSLHKPELAEQGEQLASLLRQQYPVALIDEFQDTDKLQFSIFDRIYQQSQAHALLMIGDPKQAIYSFRGADIQTYFIAREKADATQQFTLACNYRSLPSLVKVVNQLFSQHDAAFAQRGFPDYPQVESPETFQDWQGLSCQDAQTGQVVDAALSVLHAELDESPLPTVELAAKLCAEYIAKALNSQSLLNNKLIQPKDIAILVRSAKQAQLMQIALRRVGINSVYLAKDSVLDSDELKPFISLLHACIDPYDQEALFSALADNLLAYSQREIADLQNDAQALYALQEMLAKARALSERKGFLLMWQYLCAELSILERILIRPQGERVLSNVNQLAELFHQQDFSHDFALQFKQFQHFCFSENLSAQAFAQSQKLRLETEANLVEIATIHSSKGLEYPMVCCPFVAMPPANISGINKLYNSQQSAYEIIYRAKDVHKEALKQAELAENVRLLYVALTRAKYHLNICWLKGNGVDKTAMWHLIHNVGGLTTAKGMSDQAFLQPFTTLDNCVINPAFTDNTLACTATDKNATKGHSANKLIEPPSLSRDYTYQVVARSYSALLPSHSHKASKPANDLIQDQLDDGQREFSLGGLDEGEIAESAIIVDQFEADNLTTDNMGINDDLLSPPEQELATIFNFAKGANAGNFLHLALEDMDFKQQGGDLNVVLPPLFERFNLDQRWLDCISAQLRLCVTKPLAFIQASLSDLPPSAIKKEMAFHLIAKPTQGEEIARLLSQYRGGESVDLFNDIAGYFKGFIDLCFEHGGKYYVLDYKSNHLGEQLTDYSDEAMHEQMQSHYYDLQYLIYTLALHRFLKLRIPNYDFDQYIGGSCYMFLRGLSIDDQAAINDQREPDEHGQRNSQYGIYFKKAERWIIEALDKLFEQGSLVQGLEKSLEQSLEPAPTLVNEKAGERKVQASTADKSQRNQNLSDDDFKPSPDDQISLLP